MFSTGFTTCTCDDSGQWDCRNSLELGRSRVQFRAKGCSPGSVNVLHQSAWLFSNVSSSRGGTRGNAFIKIHTDNLWPVGSLHNDSPAGGIILFFLKINQLMLSHMSEN